METLLGKRTRGCIYKAILKNGREVARASHGRRLLQEEVGYENETRVLSSSWNNQHFIKLLGICESMQKKKSFLWLELMESGTPFYLLHQNQEAIP